MKSLKFKLTPLLFLFALVSFMSSCERDAIENNKVDDTQEGLEFNESMVDYSEVITVETPDGMSKEEAFKMFKSMSEDELKTIGKVGANDSESDLESRVCTPWELYYTNYYTSCQRCGSGFTHHQVRYYYRYCNGGWRFWSLPETFCRSYC